MQFKSILIAVLLSASASVYAQSDSSESTETTSNITTPVVIIQDYHKNGEEEEEDSGFRLGDDDFSNLDIVAFIRRLLLGDNK